jgi:3-hydroxybutyryl-CoA dehydrogenase
MTGLSTVLDICQHLLPELARQRDDVAGRGKGGQRRYRRRSGQGFYRWDEARKYIQSARGHQLRYALKP